MGARTVWSCINPGTCFIQAPSCHDRGPCKKTTWILISQDHSCINRNRNYSEKGHHGDGQSRVRYVLFMVQYLFGDESDKYLISKLYDTSMTLAAGRPLLSVILCTYYSFVFISTCTLFRRAGLSKLQACTKRPHHHTPQFNYLRDRLLVIPTY